MFSLEPRPYTDPDVARMVADVQAEYVVMYGGPDAAAVDPGEFDPPDGLLLVGLVDGTAVAMGGWRRIPVGEVPTAELKRMYVAPDARGQGLSRLVLAAIEDSARAAGIEQLVLNTGPVQVAAVTLYESAGYRPVTPFGHYACSPDAVFLGKALVAARR